MQQVTGISSLPAQILALTADDGSEVTLTLTYSSQQQGWFFDTSWNGTNPATQILGRRITCYPNLLRQYRNLLTFGLACYTADGQEPTDGDAFSSGYATLLLLSATDVAQAESQIFARA